MQLQGVDNLERAGGRGGQSWARAVETAATTIRSRPSAARIQPAKAGASGRIIIRPYLLLRLESPDGSAGGVQSRARTVETAAIANLLMRQPTPLGSERNV